jgi:hypothetical protein
MRALLTVARTLARSPDADKIAGQRMAGGA